MHKINRPNLFNFATSELSQDAFICWFISWAKPEYKSNHEKLHSLSHELLRKFFEMSEVSFPPHIESVDVDRQYKNIDVLIKINDSTAILIEDKVKSKEHSNQLKRYKNLLQSEGFSDDRLITIYLQTGEQSNYKNVTEAGYKCFSRTDFLNILRRGKNIENDVFTDFLDYLESIEKRFSSYQVLELGKWDGYSWQGFYSSLVEKLPDGNWDYTSNPSGGFFGFWWHWCEVGECEQYIQLEQDKLCFKISVEGSEKRQDPQWKKEQQWKWHQQILDAGQNSDLSLKKPVLRTGTWMTVAVVDGDYRQADELGRIDLDKTFQVIKQAEEILDKATKL